MTINKISIVILNYNSTEHTRKCLDSCLTLDYPMYDIILVDNASRDKRYRRIIQQHPEIILIENDKNLGFSGGNNTGIRYAIEHGAEFILLLNNDTTVASDLLAQLATNWHSLDKPGALGCKVLMMNQPHVINSFGCNLTYRPLRVSHRYKGENDGQHLNSIQETDYIHGCALFTSKQVLETVGLLDDNYFLYWEDVDFSFRIKRAGYKLYCTPKAKVWHHISGSSTSVGRTPAMQYYGVRNMLLFVSKNIPEYDAMQEVMDGMEAFKKEKYTPLKNTMIKASRMGIEDYKHLRFGPTSHYFKNREQYFEYHWRMTWINLKNFIYKIVNR